MTISPTLEKRLITETAILRSTAHELLALCETIKRSAGMIDPEPREEAQHDYPHGPEMGWDAANFTEEDHATPEEQNAAGVLIADGTQED